MDTNHNKEARAAKYQLHADICSELNALYQDKNEDYEDSFSKGIDDMGYMSALVRIDDKIRRFRKLISSEDKAQVADESLLDTLKDLANYSLMLVVEYESRQQEGNK